MTEEKMRSKVWESEEALEGLRRILLEHGEDISRHDYNQIRVAGKPGSSALARLFGSWNEAKEKALPDSTDAKKQYLVKQNRKLIDKVEYHRNIAQVFVDNCLGAIERISFRPVPVPIKEKRTKENLEFHALRSDAHVGELVDEKMVQGISTYSTNTYIERLDKWKEKVIDFRYQDKRSLGLNKLVLHYLGDQVTGEQIFKGQPFYIDLSLTDQLFTALERETNVILALAKIFPEVEIFCVVGNHGRPGNKGQHHQRTNFDYIFYRSLKAALKHQKNVKVYVSESPSMIVTHGEKIFLLNHGDTAKGWMGIPWYGLERQFRRLPGLYNMIIDYEFVAHHHQAANIADKMIMNGSMIGGSDLSINKMGLTDIASQKIFYFHGKHGINRESNLRLSEKVKLIPDERGIYTSNV